MQHHDLSGKDWQETDWAVVLFFGCNKICRYQKKEKNKKTDRRPHLILFILYFPLLILWATITFDKDLNKTIKAKDGHPWRDINIIDPSFHFKLPISTLYTDHNQSTSRATDGWSIKSKWLKGSPSWSFGKIQINSTKKHNQVSVLCKFSWHRWCQCPQV